MKNPSAPASDVKISLINNFLEAEKSVPSKGENLRNSNNRYLQGFRKINSTTPIDSTPFLQKDQRKIQKKPIKR